jgi:parallel beta-helix repeat protein
LPLVPVLEPQPTALGSGGGGGGTSGKGGGAIKLNVTDTATINGAISANGSNGSGNYAGGSGGGIWLICNTLAGTGSITANGGDGGNTTYPGGGGGGRISLQWTGGNRTFSGTISAAGGLGYRSQYGRPGTIYVPAGLWNELWNATYSVNGSVALVPGTYNITTLNVTNNAVLSCQGDDDGDPVNGSGVVINSDNITIDSGAKISANAEGFVHDAGPGKPVNAGDCSGGGGYGGRAGDGRDSLGGLTYGSFDQPTALGSGGGGGTSGKGGGAIKLSVTNTLTINGTISANGTQGLGNYAGGSGGSIWLISNTLAGAGSIAADGGDSANTTYPGGGGGGRISLQWTGGNRTFSGTITAAGGLGYRSQYGRPGTIYVPAGLWNELWNATYSVNGSVALVPGTYNITTLNVTNNAVLSCQGDDDGDPVNGSGVVINSDNITIDSGAKISANGEGFVHDAGPGKPVNAGDCSGGGGSGGTGGDGRDSAGGPTYGLIYEPTALGSGGGGGIAGRGGGAAKLNVTNTLTINGTISANGTQGLGNYAGGSGGSIWLICNTLAGAGSIAADGGDGANTTYPGGGGGGRIHISRTTWDYTGTVSVSGGIGLDNGDDGTLYYDNPFLDWTGEANYTSDGLDPGWGDGTTSFTYRIKYTHINDTAPPAGHPRVHILKDGSDITGSPFSMLEVDGGDTTYDDGKLYYYSTTLTEGSYSYYFEADVPSCGPAMGDGISESSGPTVLENAAFNGGTPYPTIQAAIDDASYGDTITINTGFTHYEQITLPSGVTLVGDTADPTSTAISADSAPVVSFAAASSGSALKGLTIRYTGENATRNVAGRQHYVDIDDGTSDITIDKCLIGRDDYVSGWSGTDSRFLATTTYNDGGIRVGENSSNVTITNSKIRYVTGPGIGIQTGSNNNITISNNYIYRNILPYDVRVAPYREAPGIGLNGTARATITSNKIYENNVGIGSYGLTGTDGTEGTIYIQANVIHHNNRGGIGFNVYSGNYFKSAEITGNDIYSDGTKNKGAIRIRYAYDLKLSQNRIHNSGYGIYLYRVYDSELSNNEVYSNRRGTYIERAYRIKIKQNYLHDNGSKIPALYCNRIYDFDIYNNKLYRNGRRNVLLNYAGVNLKDQSFFHNNILEGTASYGGKGYGLRVDRGANIVVSSNIIKNSNWAGAYFNTQSGPIDFRHNKVLDNGRTGVRVVNQFSGNMFKNLIFSNNYSGIRCDNNASGNLKIYNNTIADNLRSGVWFQGGLTTSTYSLSNNIFAFNTEAGYRYGGTTWPAKDRWDWVDKDKNFFFWNYASLSGGTYNHEATQFLNAQWGGPGGTGTDDITMEEAHRNNDQNAWDFSNDPDDPYSLDPLDTTGVLEAADGESAGAYSDYEGSSATYTAEPDVPLTPPGDPYVEGSTVDPPTVPAVADIGEPFSG